MLLAVGIDDLGEPKYNASEYQFPVLSKYFLVNGRFFLCVPLARMDKGVCNYVLRKNPIGISMEEVVTIAEKESWEIRDINNERGLCINDSTGNVSVARKDEMQNGVETDHVRIVGEKAMIIELGEFNEPFHTAVFAYLAFDENCELVEASIRRDIDAV